MELSVARVPDSECTEENGGETTPLQRKLAAVNWSRRLADYETSRIVLDYLTASVFAVILGQCTKTRGVPVDLVFSWKWISSITH